MNSPNDNLRAFFVYGSLKRGFLRETIWPKTPEQVAPATIQAKLFDLGPYPGLQAGDETVLGELWHFSPQDMKDTIAAVDEAEGFNQPGEPNYYERKTVVVTKEDGSTENAYAYFIGTVGREREARWIEPWMEWNRQQVASWPDPHSRVPRSLEDE